MFLALVVSIGLGDERTGAQRRRLVTGEHSGRMGDYEVVPDWPKPLPDTDLSHDGWTWGSGARRVGRESRQGVGDAARRDRAAARRRTVDLRRAC